MQLKQRDGIACDYCGTSYRNDFDYFSLDFHHVSVHNNNRMPLEHILRTQIVFSVDICSSCFDSFKSKIVSNYQKVMSHKRSTQQKLVCDWTGVVLSGTFDFYYCTVTKVNVVLTGQPNICVGCDHKTFDDDKLCSKCGGSDFIKPALVNPDPRFVELVLCEDAYNHFVDKSKSVRKIAGEWSSKS